MTRTDNVPIDQCHKRIAQAEQGMLVEVIVEDERWHDAEIETLAETAALSTLAHLGLEPADFEIAVLASDDARIAALNAQFRGKSGATNVLSWPAVDLAADVDGVAPVLPGPDREGEPLALGDIALGYETCRREAAEQGKRLADHVTHLVVHGVLHLLGYDHIRDKDATVMEGCEQSILGKLGVADPYDAQRGHLDPT